ncbi:MULTISPECIES: hypothetical protein [Streptomycetaceae]|uniref:Uncharacterized protein n=1 Tax=Streptantibioticus cattleyicolor (strain ATCC 35852 / DSM 46488 / JCM 4925 / NBRC 14057 / NRRL 8057) TaxID=1003195 RepID=F8K134_STREN|nr:MULTISPECIES: hypothetical protein [Streptomycetaceae]AEW94898.1 hypothetical protein SCATT_25270 [Streptantibioticus cattleyicolor NRRL 8057 = DSM 46488]MYS59506.1 hypothetical protein [Streptomyces sp. SID5468]CCB75248.1 exported protein of unknown function [Streptantibioticus cattleyicolor NRRL 8057 = DSM 46488]
MTTRRARRTVRSAGLLAIAAAAAFSLTACGPNDPAGSSNAAGSGNASASTSTSGTGSTGSSAQGGTSGTHHSTTAGTASTNGGTTSPTRTQTLPDGSKAEIYRLGSQHYRAKIVNNGSVLATLETNQHDAGLDANDMFVVLTLDGQVHAWMGGGHQGPGTFDLAGGWKAKVTKVGELRYRAQIIGNDGSVDATLETDQHDVGLDANGAYVVLSNGGVISAHM